MKIYKNQSKINNNKKILNVKVVEKNQVHYRIKMSIL
jgi:hypothetical protein